MIIEKKYIERNGNEEIEKIDKGILRNIEGLLDMTFPMIKRISIKIDNCPYGISSFNNLTKLLDLLRLFSIDINIFYKGVTDQKITDEFCDFIGFCWFTPVNKNLGLSYNLKESRAITYKGNWGSNPFCKTESPIITDSLITKVAFSTEIVMQNLKGARVFDNLYLIIDYMSEFVIGYDQKKLNDL